MPDWLAKAILRLAAIAVLTTGLSLPLAPLHAQTGAPIKIGLSTQLTGPLAGNGKQILLTAQIWTEEINAKGGLLGRPVELVYYDDQSLPANIPGIYAKLIDIDKSTPSLASRPISPLRPCRSSCNTAS